jgi:hypothetical protein
MSFSKPPDYNPLFAQLAAKQQSIISSAPPPPPMFGDPAALPQFQRKSTLPTQLGSAMIPQGSQLGARSLVGSA